MASAKDRYLATFPKGHFLRKDRHADCGRKRIRPIPRFTLGRIDGGLSDYDSPFRATGRPWPLSCAWLRPWPRGPTRLWGWLCRPMGDRGPSCRSRLLVPADTPGSRSRPMLPAPGPAILPAPIRPILPAPGPGRYSRPRPIMSILPVASDCPVALSTSIAACIRISGCNTLAKTAGCRGFSGRNGWPLGLTLNRGRNFSQA